MKLPHYVLVVFGAVGVVLTWVMDQQAQGQLTIPATVMTLLLVAKTAIGILSSSASDNVNKEAVRRAATKASGLLCLCLTLSALACSSCTKEQGSQAVQVSVDATICVLQHFDDPPLKIAEECGIPAVEDVVRILDAHKAAMARQLADAGAVKP